MTMEADGTRHRGLPRTTCQGGYEKFWPMSLLDFLSAFVTDFVINREEKTRGQPANLDSSGK